MFRFLFQSGFAVENSLLEMIDSEELIPVLSVMQKAMNTNIEQTKEVFVTLAMFVHGYASIIANNSLEYDEELVALGNVMRSFMQTGNMLPVRDVSAVGRSTRRNVL